jgi:hypothetical protein
MSAAILGAQTKSSDNSAKASDNGKSASAASTVTFTGCLAPGTKADAFYLTNAKEKGVKGAPATVKVVPATKKVDVNSFIAHEVEVTGTLEQAGTSASSETAPTLSATKVKFGAGGAC